MLRLQLALSALLVLAAWPVAPAEAQVAEIFAGTWGPAGTLQGRVYRWVEGTTWEDLLLPEAGNDAVWSLAWYEGKLWAATMEGEPSFRDPSIAHGTGGHVWRWDGDGWEEVSPPGGFGSAATTVSVMEGEVYVTVDDVGLLRWEGARDWTVVDTFRLAAQAIVSDSHAGRPMLYLGQDNTDEFWVHDPAGVTPCGTPIGFACQVPPAGDVCSAECHPGSCIHAMAVFDDGGGPRVYAGAWQGRMYRWDPTSRLFEDIDDIPDEPTPLEELQHVQGLASFQGQLWAGVSDGKLWASTDATEATWQEVLDFDVASPFSDLLAVPEDDLLWMGYGGVPWRWARRTGEPAVRTYDGTTVVDRSEPGQFGQGVLVLLAVVPEIECDAGPVQTVECATRPTPVVLDGSGTVVSQGFDPTYTWTGAFVEGTADGVMPTVHFEGIGDYTVTLTVTAGRRTESCTTRVVIEDTVAPTLPVAGRCLWPPNHRYRCFLAADLVASATGRAFDDCAGEIEVSIVGVASSQPEDATGRGDGATLDDMLFDAERVCVRGERQGADPAGRDYLVTLQAVDPSGNVALEVVTLHVPHDQSAPDHCRDSPPDVGLRPNEPLPLGDDRREGTYP